MSDYLIKCVCGRFHFIDDPCLCDLLKERAEHEVLQQIAQQLQEGFGELAGRCGMYEKQVADLRKCHEAELGVCEKYCDVVADLKQRIRELEVHKKEK